MSKHSSAKYYQNNKERQKSLKNKKIVNDTKVYQKMKNKILLSIEKKL